MTARIKVGIAAVIVIALSWAIALSSGAAAPRLAAAVVSQHTVQDGYIECVIGLTNLGGPVSYTGYGKDSPLYSFIHAKPGDGMGQMGWCGTGLGQRTLTKGEGVEFKVHYYSTNAPTHLMMNYQESRLLDRLLARGPQYLRSRMKPRTWLTLRVPLGN